MVDIIINGPYLKVQSFIPFCETWKKVGLISEVELEHLDFINLNHSGEIISDVISNHSNLSTFFVLAGFLE